MSGICGAPAISNERQRNETRDAIIDALQLGPGEPFTVVAAQGERW